MVKRILSLLCVFLLVAPTALCEYESDSTLRDRFLKGERLTEEEEIELEIPELRLEPSYGGERVSLGDTGASVLLPTDWVPLPTEEGALCTYGNHKTVTMSVYRERGTIEKRYAEYSAQVEAESAYDDKPLEEGQKPEQLPTSLCQMLRMNGRLFVNYTDASGKDHAYTALDGDTVLRFTFAYAGTSTAQSGLPAEILASIEP